MHIICTHDLSWFLCVWANSLTDWFTTGQTITRTLRSMRIMRSIGRSIITIIITIHLWFAQWLTNADNCLNLKSRPETCQSNSWANRSLKRQLSDTNCSVLFYSVMYWTVLFCSEHWMHLSVWFDYELYWNHNFDTFWHFSVPLLLVVKKSNN